MATIDRRRSFIFLNPNMYTDEFTGNPAFEPGDLNEVPLVSIGEEEHLSISMSYFSTITLQFQNHAVQKIWNKVKRLFKITRFTTTHKIKPAGRLHEVWPPHYDWDSYPISERDLIVDSIDHTNDAEHRVYDVLFRKAMGTLDLRLRASYIHLDASVWWNLKYNRHFVDTTVDGGDFSGENTYHMIEVCRDEEAVKRFLTELSVEE